MMKQRVSKLNSYFEEQIALCEQRGKGLMADDRRDEATFEKVRANVYDIFRTILSVAVKTCKEDPEAVRQFFLRRIEQIPSNWTVSYQQAKQHGDTIKMQIEQIKLDTIDEIKKSFAQIWEEEA